jgi:hypothetical protein
MTSHRDIYIYLQPVQSDTGSLDPKSSKTRQFSVITRFIGIESHASESYYHSYTVATSGVNLLVSQSCHNRLFRKKLQQNILPMISTEVSSLAADNKREIIDGKQVERIGTIALGIDNKGCVDIAHANGVTKLSKHLEVKHKYLQQQVSAGHVRLTQISNADQKADFLTKPLNRTLFTRACAALLLT